MHVAIWEKLKALFIKFYTGHFDHDIVHEFKFSLHSDKKRDHLFEGLYLCLYFLLKEILTVF